MISSQLSLLLFLAICVIVHPGFVLKWNEVGLSNYGIHVKTVVPYSLGLGLCSLFSIKAARALEGSERLTNDMRMLLYLYGGLVLFSLLSTYGYKLNSPLRILHIVSGCATILFEFGASLWIFVRLRSARMDVVWLGVQLVGFVLALLDFFEVLHVLFLAQLLTGVGFGLLAVHAAQRLALPSPARIKSTENSEKPNLA